MEDMAKTRWWSRTRGVPEDVYRSWAASIGALPGRQVRVLAWATTLDGYAVASPSVLSYSGSGAGAAGAAAPTVEPSHGDPADTEPAAAGPARGELGWVHLGWHEIERGGWDEESGRLVWSRYPDRDRGPRAPGDGGAAAGADSAAAVDGSAADVDGGVVLTEPGRVPEVFRERVAASIVLEKFVPIRNGRGVLISGRRDLAEGEVSIAWNSRLQRGLTWQTEGVRAAADAAIAQVRTEYDMG